MKLIFVCSGNTCRSPLAWAAWQKCARELPVLCDIEVSCAGICPDDGADAASHARLIAQGWGVDLSSHHARLFTPEDAESDLIVTLTQDQADVLRAHFALEDSRVRVLGSFASRAPRRHARAQLKPLFGTDAGSFAPVDDDIFDPFGGSVEAYTDCAAQIERAVRELALFLAKNRASEAL